MNTVTEETPTRQTRLNVGFEAHQGASGKTEAWKRSIGNRVWQHVWRCCRKANRGWAEWASA